MYYLYATLTPSGIISAIGGKVFQESNNNETDLIGKEFSEISYWNYNKNISERIRSAIVEVNQGSDLEFETILQTVSSKNIPVKVKFGPVFNEKKQIEKINFSSIDVSKYVREIDFHKRRSERFLFAAECAEVGLWFWNIQDNEIFTTPLCNKIYGLPPDEIMTYQKFIETIFPQDLPKVQEVLNKSQNDLTDYNIEYRVKTDSDKIIWLTLRGKTIQEDSDTTIMTGSVRDITHRKLSDERLQKLYEIEKTSKAEIEEVNLQKNHFLAIVSHELRSPLQSILGWSKILLSNQVDEETQQKALETIENSAKLQAKLISDLVDSAKIISGNLDFSIKILDLGKLINSVYQSQKPLADEKNINLILGNISNIEVFGDGLRLQQAVTNLVSNAIKFTPPEGVVLIKLTEQNKQAVLTVTDSGSGIPPEDLPLIFKQYFQSKSSQNKTGLGLGLSIVKAIIGKHQGQVKVKNNDSGIGCTFSLILPLQQTEEANNSKPLLENKNPSLPLKNVKILIVEDNQDSREVLDFYLSRLGAKIHPAASAAEGLSYLTSADYLPDIIISDISMPEEDGYSFIKKVRNLPNQSSIPAIALTAFASSNDEKKVIEAGFQKYHTKPFEPNLLISDILEVISKN